MPRVVGQGKGGVIQVSSRCTQNTDASLLLNRVKNK